MRQRYYNTNSNKRAGADRKRQAKSERATRRDEKNEQVE